VLVRSEGRHRVLLKVWATAASVGFEPSPPTTTVVRTQGGDSKTIPVLDPVESYSVTLGADFEGSGCSQSEVTVEVDPENHIAESNGWKVVS